jgi:hypothetical protein
MLQKNNTATCVASRRAHVFLEPSGLSTVALNHGTCQEENRQGFVAKVRRCGSRDSGDPRNQSRTSREVEMKIVLVLSAALLSAESTPPAEQSPETVNGPVFQTQVNGAAQHYEATNHASWHLLPFYYGRGEWHMRHHGGDGWGCCPTPNSCHMNLWDDYCYENTHCGWNLGHFRGFWNNCGRCCHTGCGERGACAHRAEEEAPEAQTTPESRDEAPPKVVPPSAKRNEKVAPVRHSAKTVTKPKLDQPATKTSRLPMSYGSTGAEWRPVLSWPRFLGSR